MFWYRSELVIRYIDISDTWVMMYKVLFSCLCKQIDHTHSRLTESSRLILWTPISTSDASSCFIFDADDIICPTLMLTDEFTCTCKRTRHSFVNLFWSIDKRLPWIWYFSWFECWSTFFHKRVHVFQSPTVIRHVFETTASLASSVFLVPSGPILRHRFYKVKLLKKYVLFIPMT